MSTAKSVHPKTLETTLILSIGAKFLSQERNIMLCEFCNKDHIRAFCYDSLGEN
jgi:hypothetical protein